MLAVNLAQKCDMIGMLEIEISQHTSKILHESIKNAFIMITLQPLRLKVNSLNQSCTSISSKLIMIVRLTDHDSAAY